MRLRNVGKARCRLILSILNKSPNHKHYISNINKNGWIESNRIEWDWIGSNGAGSELFYGSEHPLFQ